MEKTVLLSNSKPYPTPRQTPPSPSPRQAPPTPPTPPRQTPPKNDGDPTGF